MSNPPIDIMEIARQRIHAAHNLWFAEHSMAADVAIEHACWDIWAIRKFVTEIQRETSQ